MASALTDAIVKSGLEWTLDDSIPPPEHQIIRHKQRIIAADGETMRNSIPNEIRMELWDHRLTNSPKYIVYGMEQCNTIAVTFPIGYLGDESKKK